MPHEFIWTRSFWAFRESENLGDDVCQVSFSDLNRNNRLGDESYQSSQNAADWFHGSDSVWPLPTPILSVLNIDYTYSADNVVQIGTADFLSVTSGSDEWYIPLDPFVITGLVSVQSDTAALVQADTSQLQYTDIPLGTPAEDGGAITGTSASESLFGSLGADEMDGGRGHDTLFGRRGDDRMDGGGGDDELRGIGDDDFLSGGGGEDRLFGGRGDDTLFDGYGQDVLMGGEGRDIFVLEPDARVDTILDFTRGEDKIDLSAYGIDFEDLVITDAQAGFVRVEIDGEVLRLLQRNDVFDAQDLTEDDFLMG